MNGEGITSLAVVDNLLNVIGNISTADVKVWTRIFGARACLTYAASDAILVTPPATQHLHPLYFRHPVYARLNGWKGFLPGVPCQPHLNACPCRGQGRSYQIASVSQVVLHRHKGELIHVQTMGD